ncbi:Uncharacterized protein TCM_023830 [Theobroma cacao]|uniref:Uncharacterized protein n=1 Tax=Theobroma cacao TaxID=3641 RepID=A0A061EUJ6_THECC|nr:Uncharacterized protein TCM_023830 [Theobroma cacao]
MTPPAKAYQPSLLWRHITKPLNLTSKYHDLVTAGFGHSLRNIYTICFWTNTWVGNSSLSIQFPRIFALAKDKKASIVDTGKWINNKWT